MGASGREVTGDISLDSCRNHHLRTEGLIFFLFGPWDVAKEASFCGGCFKIIICGRRNSNSNM